jgi:hypothetical protein
VKASADISDWFQSILPQKRIFAIMPISAQGISPIALISLLTVQGTDSLIRQ